MTQFKTVYIRRGEPEMRDAFIAGAPPNCQVVILDPNSTDEEFIEQVRDADFLVCSRTGHPKGRFPDQMIREATRLKLILSLGQGTDQVPMRIALERGIPVVNSGGANAIAVAEHAVLLMLAVMRRLLPSVETIRKGKFRTDLGLESNYFHQLYEKTVGIVGLGSIGQRVAKMVRGFDAKVIFTEKSEAPLSIVTDLQARRVNLEELLSSADIISLHVPLLESTRRMIGWKQLTMMKPSAILINTSRGDVVDEEALIRALREKKIVGAGLDVFEQEPTSLDNPLLSMDNVVATPHTGGVASENLAPRIKIVWDNVLRVWEGKEPHNIVSSF
ncbi:2-hydroxyacid dehydrogenase [Chloroflexota bacterium]